MPCYPNWSPLPPESEDGSYIYIRSSFVEEKHTTEYARICVELRFNSHHIHRNIPQAGHNNKGKNKLLHDFICDVLHTFLYELCNQTRSALCNQIKRRG